jgi:hypothetical protein
MASIGSQNEQTMISPTAGSTHCIPSELDDEIDNATLPFGHVWAIPCKLPSCPDHGKTWILRSNFLSHLNEGDAHMPTGATPAARRTIELEWRYVTDPHLPPRAAPDFLPQEDPEQHIWTYSVRDSTGRVVTRTGTQRQMDEDLRKAGTQGGAI